MNQSDRKLIIISLILSLLSICFLFLTKKNGDKKVTVYRNNQVVLEIPLTKEKNTYQVDGKLGIVEITIQDYGVMVEKENSPKHLCSKQGFIKETYESIICLPNEIIVKISALDSDTLDTVVK